MTWLQQMKNIGPAFWPFVCLSLQFRKAGDFTFECLYTEIIINAKDKKENWTENEKVFLFSSLAIIFRISKVTGI